MFESAMLILMDVDNVFRDVFLSFKVVEDSPFAFLA